MAEDQKHKPNELLHMKARIIPVSDYSVHSINEFYQNAFIAHGDPPTSGLYVVRTWKTH